MKRILVLIGVIFLACQVSKDRVTWNISDFTSSISTTLKPYEGKTYVTNYIKISGYVNDTIKIVQRKPYYDIVLSGKLDTIIRMDYYGGTNKTFIFEPYRATKGKLKIEISL